MWPNSHYCVQTGINSKTPHQHLMHSHFSHQPNYRIELNQKPLSMICPTDHYKCNNPLPPPLSCTVKSFPPNPDPLLVVFNIGLYMGKLMVKNICYAFLLLACNSTFHLFPSRPLLFLPFAFGPLGTVDRVGG